MQLEKANHPAFSLVLDENAGILRVRASGELDLTVAGEFRDSMDEPLSGPSRAVILDLGELDFIDSTGLRVLVDVKRRTDAAGKKLYLGPVAKPVLKLLEVAGLLAWFEYLDGDEPVLRMCPACDNEVLAGDRRCLRCGAAI